eukprot:jgi/Chlat1/1585/Chrsp123S08669
MCGIVRKAGAIPLLETPGVTTETSLTGWSEGEMQSQTCIAKNVLAWTCDGLNHLQKAMVMQIGPSKNGFVPGDVADQALAGVHLHLDKILVRKVMRAFTALWIWRHQAFGQSFQDLGEGGAEGEVAAFIQWKQPCSVNNKRLHAGMPNGAMGRGMGQGGRGRGFMPGPNMMFPMPFDGPWGGPMMPGPGMMGPGHGMEPGFGPGIVPGMMHPPGMGPGMGMGMDPFMHGPGRPGMPPAAAAGIGRGQSRGEQNDYSQHFVDTGQRPQNFIRDVDVVDRFEEYPKLKELISRKDALIAERSTPAMYKQLDLKEVELSPALFGGVKFDVVLIDPPMEEYARRAPGEKTSNFNHFSAQRLAKLVKSYLVLHAGISEKLETWTWEEIAALRIEAIADTPSFLFLWVGDGEGLDKGRNCLRKWGYRRCEDICWVKTNRERMSDTLIHDETTILQHTKEHCLMGIKGTVRRSTDGHLIHANIDTDIMISKEPPYGSTAKPDELYSIIEHFVQGRRRLELFGEDHNIRQGWITLGKSLTSSSFNPEAYAACFQGKDLHLVGTTPEIEALRPKSPPATRGPMQSGASPAAPSHNAKAGMMKP